MDFSNFAGPSGPWARRNVSLDFVGIVAAGFLSGCAILSSPGLPPEGFEARLRRMDPEHPEFERRLHEGADLFESLLAIDRSIYPRIEAPRVRAAFEALVVEATRDLRFARGAPPLSVTPEEASRVFLSVLRRRGFVPDLSPGRIGEPNSKVMSHTLLARAGCCGTFSLLVVSYLERMQLGSSIVCLPDHCFVRIDQPHHPISVESTDFDAPVRPSSWGESSAGDQRIAGHYGRSLTREQTLWHYFVDRLWAWSDWPCTDEWALGSLRRARTILGSSCQSIDAHEACRYLSLARGSGVPEARRRSAWQESFSRFRRLSLIYPEMPDFRAALEELNLLAHGLRVVPTADDPQRDRGALAFERSGTP